MKNGYNAYAQNSVMVESPYKLTQMLYEGILKFTSQAKRAINEGEIEKRVYYINRATAIYVELIATLNFDGGEIAHYLHGLYNYQLKLLSEANLENSLTKIEEAINVASVLLEAWKEETQNEPAVA
ncbi:MAG: flagella export chaperone FliS [Sulfurospirillum sp.]|nr:MAG: flagella export chaperone FliS [Sulfurospirillum sp.]